MCRFTIKPTWRGWPACSSGQIQCSRRSMRSRRAEAAVARPLIPNPPVRIEVELRLGEKCSLLQAGGTLGQDAADFFCGRPASMAAKSRQPRRPCQGRLTWPLLHLQFHVSWQRCRRKLLPPTLRTVATVGLFTLLVPPKVMDGSHRARSFARWQRQASGRPGFWSTSFVGSSPSLDPPNISSVRQALLAGDFNAAMEALDVLLSQHVDSGRFFAKLMLALMRHNPGSHTAVSTR